jgi:hypothetical protein
VLVVAVKALLGGTMVSLFAVLHLHLSQAADANRMFQERQTERSKYRSDPERSALQPESTSS